MPTLQAVIAFLEELAPPRLAEAWDNVGLLVGDRRREIRRIMTCLTITPDAAAEAIQGGADLIVAHHPLPLTAVRRVTADTTVGRLLGDLIAERIAVFSPHTSLDSAAEGINQQLAAGLGLRGIVALVPHAEGQGAGRCGWFEEPLALEHLARRLMDFLHIERLQMVGDPHRPVRLAAVACGSGGEFLGPAQTAGCDALVIGETRFHTCLEAEAEGIGLLLPGHFASERFALDDLAGVLARQFPGIDVWASRREHDPIQWVGREGGRIKEER
ncbi:MAG: Nif3-like dinuclear metal center hexameric protein [Thermoguttaceae bacterium]|jgi:dinuclear metal center YbgI/SA1388 family protein